MSKAVMISIRPKWCNLIESGKKTIEVRKTRPKIETPFKCYIYCTQDKHDSFICRGGDDLPFDVGNGMVIGEFVCDYIEYYVRVGFDGCPNAKISYFRVDDRCYIHPINYENMQLSKEQLERYTDGMPAYGWHISDLVIYDQSKELKEFNISRPPQSWCYVEELEET